MDITVEKKRVLSFKDVAQALASEYIAIYYVNTETDSFEQYSTNGSGRGIAEERHGEHFFGQARRDIKTMVYEPDCETFLQIFNKENVLRTIEETGAFTHTYRLLIKGEPTYALMKIVRMGGDNKHLVIGVYNADVQMRQKEALEHLKEEHTTYTRIMALLGDFYALYTVDPESGRYTQYRTSAEFSEIPSSSGGEDFYEDAIRDIRHVIHPDDYEHFVKAFSKEKILSKTKNGEIYKVHYRLMMGEGPTEVILRAGMITEDNTTQMIVGVGRSSQEE
jgi:hypothetical protein